MKTILLVEDEALIGLDETRILRSHGFDVVFAQSGEKAVDAVRSNQSIDLVLMDVDLGRGMDGTEAAEIIIRQRDIPVVFLSNHVEREVVEKTERISAYGYVVKGAGETVLVASIKMAFKLHDALQAGREREEALRRSESKYRHLVETMPDGVYKSSHAGKFLEVNSAMVDILGYDSREELMEIDIKRQLYFDATDRESAALEEKLEEMAIFRVKKKDGSEIWVEDHGRHVLDDKGNVLYHEGILRDVTERVRAEGAIRESEEKYRRLFENATVGIFYSLPEGKFLKVNPALARMLGYSTPEEMISLVTDIRTQIYVDSKKHAAVFARTLETDSWAYAENTYRRKDGSLMTANLAVRRALHPDGTLAYLEGIVEDITEQRRAETMIAEALKEKEALLRELQHRIKNSLTVMASIVDLERRHSASPEVANVLNDISHRIKSISELYQLMWSSGEIHTVRLDSYLRQIVSTVVQSYSVLESKVVVDTDLAAIELSSRQAAPVGLIANELLTNIFKYAFPDNRSGHVQVRLAKSPAELSLEISDDGVGLPVAFVPERSDGLGMLLVTALVHQLGGVLTINPKDPTSFKITVQLD